MRVAAATVDAVEGFVGIAYAVVSCIVRIVCEGVVFRNAWLVLDSPNEPSSFFAQSFALPWREPTAGCAGTTAARRAATVSFCTIRGL